MLGIVTENQLDQWVRFNSEIAQGKIVELIARLTAASCPKPNNRRFPLSDSIGQPGPDGILDTEEGYKSYVPKGKSLWEIGTGGKPGEKATSDYKDRTISMPEEVRKESTFIFVTPLSGTKDWQYTWKEDAQQSWLDERLKKKEWKDIKVIDGTVLIDWLHDLPSVELWMANTMGLSVGNVQTLEQHWDELKTIGSPPTLKPIVFTKGRDEANEKLRGIIEGTHLQLKIDTFFPGDVADFVAAYCACLEDNEKIEVMGRSLVVSSAQDWSSITGLRDRHILIANFGLDNEQDGIKLLQKAQRAGHSVVYGSIPGGPPHPYRAPLPHPKPHMLEDALKESGYNEQRANTLAHRSGGNLKSLLKCVQNLSLAPEWAQNSEASELVIADLFGSWNDGSEGDKSSIEQFLGKPYGEWIGKIRNIAQKPGTPLEFRSNLWRFSLRYEGWYSLGNMIYDEHLDKFKKIAVQVLKEKHPKFDLAPKDRFAASLYNKSLTHSTSIRKGLAETIALLSSHSDALTKCTITKPEATARTIVRDILDDADWIQWASLNDILPLLAEAAPKEFLDAVEATLNKTPSPFEMLLNQKCGIFDENLITGILWALEVLSWDPQNLTRSVSALGELASMDKVKSNSGNRPISTLTMIFLPWIPQTCANFEQRLKAVQVLAKENADVAWRLILNLLPHSQQFSVGTSKPSWRDTIPNDWSNEVTTQQYWEEVRSYFSVAISLANNVERLTELTEYLDDMQPQIRNEYLAKLQGEASGMGIEGRTMIWSKLVDIVTNHRKFHDADWALSPQEVDNIEKIAKTIQPNEPSFMYKRLFDENDVELIEEKDDIEEQLKKLESKRVLAIKEVYEASGLWGVIDFAKKAKTPWRVGIAISKISIDANDEKEILSLTCSEDSSVAQFSGGYIMEGYSLKGWKWVDSIDMSNWTYEQIAQFYVYLPFELGTWERASTVLKSNEPLYWSKARVRPIDKNGRPEIAVENLMSCGRASDASICIYYAVALGNSSLSIQLIIDCLMAIASSENNVKTIDSHKISEIIKYLQKNPEDKHDEIMTIELLYLNVLGGEPYGSPKLLQQHLADDPKFFCDVIRGAYKSKNGEEVRENTSEKNRNLFLHAYMLLYKWKVPPGVKCDGTFDRKSFKDWVKAVTESTKESGHHEVAILRLGHVLAYSPSDPSGLWINRDVAEFLNERDMKDARDGFQTELINSRGVYTWTQGKAEKELADRYMKMGLELESHGFARFADTLKDLSHKYELDSKKSSMLDGLE